MNSKFSWHNRAIQRKLINHIISIYSFCLLWLIFRGIVARERRMERGISWTDKNAKPRTGFARTEKWKKRKKATRSAPKINSRPDVCPSSSPVYVRARPRTRAACYFFFLSSLVNSAGRLRDSNLRLFWIETYFCCTNSWLCDTGLG